MTSPVSTPHRAWPRPRGHEPLATRPARRSACTTSARRSGSRTRRSGGVLAILVVQHLPHPAAFIAEIRRCLRPGGHLLITAPVRDSTSLRSQHLYWRLRAACYHLVPGVVRFYDTNSLPRLVQDQGLTVVECNGGPGRVSVLARAQRRAPSPAGSARQSRAETHRKTADIGDNSATESAAARSTSGGHLPCVHCPR
jgi:methyltransferase family protein